MFQNVPYREQEMAGLRVSSMPAEVEAVKFDLSISFTEQDDSLQAVVEYATDLFERETVERLLTHYRRVLEQVAAHPEAKLSAVQLLSEPERQQLVVEWNRTGKAYPPGCVHELFEEQVQRTPHAWALVYEEQKLSYMELNRRANQLGHYLRELGVGPEVRVGVHAERSLEMVVGLLGVLKAGGAYVPLDPEYPAERLQYMVEDVQAAVVLTQKKLRERLPASAAVVVSLDDEEGWQSSQRGGEQDLNSGVEPGNLVYVIYTSGSTGKPKGAMNRHEGVRNRLQWMQENYELGEGDCVLQKTPFSFDVSGWEFFWPLMTGATLVMAAPGGHRDADYLVETINRYQVTTMHFVPSMLGVFLENPGAGSCRSLRQVFCSGEALSGGLVQAFHQCLGAKLHNLYGPTEASIEVT